jgi:hypothetical protein
VPAESASGPASLTLVEKAERTPEPTAAVRKAEPLGRKLADEEKRIADLEARVREAEAAAQAAKSSAAPPSVPTPPNPEPAAGEIEDPAHPLRAAHERLEPARRPAHRLSKEDFQFALDEAQRVLRNRPLNPDARYLETYARGGLAYAAGKDGIASAALVEAFTELQRRRKIGSRPFGSFLLRPDGTIRQPNGWELAIGYGDARGEAMGLIEKELAENPRNLRALRARAQLRRMQGLGE